MQKIIAVLSLMTILGCAPQVDFVRTTSERYPPKPDDYEMLVYIKGDRPEEDYKVIGVLQVQGKHGLSGPRSDKLVTVLKKEARKNGADAIIDLEIDTMSHFSYEGERLVICEAKAIVFK